ncbi:MAG: HlyD family efflux transporter periplasmic adaptor subunit [Phycisphaerales bacterium]|jgi:HlyD family secretion protein|nr:HlyD family efflux transporter periplasmic adaptor subunit [Phycisphaerales bacterium]MBT7171383.1 HlyD family efflux transporter periplasmic adaptor subunit [Phycisphaerales bacterium]
MKQKWILILILCAAGVGAWLYFSDGTTEDTTSEVASTQISRGDLVVRVRGDGELRAAQYNSISNDTHRTAVIRELVAEGAEVTKGQKIVVFESRELTDKIEEVTTNKTNAGNKALEASESLAHVTKVQAHKVNKATEALHTANENLKKYTEGQLPLKRQEFKSRIALAEQRLLQAKEKLAFKLKVNADKSLQSPYSENEIKADRISVQQLEFDLQKTNSDLKLLEDFDKPQEIRKRKSAIVDAKMALEGAEVEQRTQVRISTSNKTTADENLERIAERLLELEDEATKLVVYAESDGLVSYDTGRSRHRSEQIDVEIGAAIRPKQRIMVIPDITTLRVRFRVYESMIRRVGLDQKAIIRVGARPKATFTGKVIKIDTLPSSEDAWRNPGVKIFNVLVEFNPNQDLEGLRPGGTANVTVEADRLRNVLLAPIAAIFTRGSRRWCVKNTPQGPKAVEVQIGKINDTNVQILGGVSEGDELMLSLPKGFSLPTIKGKPKTKARATRPAGNRRPAPTS